MIGALSKGDLQAPFTSLYVKGIKTVILKTLAAAILAVTAASAASATTFSFSFDDDPSVSSFFGRTHIGGSVTGLIFGLEDDTANQTPDAIEFTSDVSGLGLTETFIDTFTVGVGDGITVSGGEIVAANILLNFNDPTVGGTQLRFNQGSGYNHLIWNGGGGPIVGIGNQDGFAGTTFSDAAVSTVPLPAGGLLLLSGFGGVIALKRRKARAA